MKSALTSLFLVVHFIIAGCKKDKDQGPLSISGEYKVYRLIIEDPDDGPQESPVPLPNGNYSKVIVTANADSSMSVKLIHLNKDNEAITELTLDGRAKKIGNSLRFMDGNNWLGTFLEKDEMELYPDGVTTLYARK
jgi:hypothetical protein